MIRDKIDKILEYSLAIILGVMVLDVLWQVMSRYLFVSPSIFTDELAAFLLIWLGILGGAYVYGRGEHLAISLLADKCRPEVQVVVRSIVELVVLLFSLSVMVVGGIWLVYTRFLLGAESASLGINWGYVYLVLPLSGVLICYYAIDNLLKLRRS